MYVRMSFRGAKKTHGPSQVVFSDMHQVNYLV